jgi:arsenate reductase
MLLILKNNQMVFTEIENLLKSFEPENIANGRKTTLQPLVDYIQEKVSNKQQIRLNFICTHNSRRSHLSQIWAQVAASFFKINNVFCYSGGTEATAMYPMIAETLTKQGFKIKILGAGKNPIYSIIFANNEHPIIGFSKSYDDDFNPKNEFTAIMTCSQADEGCPFIAGADKRISVPFNDPKAFDYIPEQAAKYEEKSLEIANEMFYVFSKIKQ